MNPLLPAMVALIVVICPVVEPLPIVITGWLAPLLSVRMFEALPLLSSVQLLDWVVASANFNVPTVRGESRLTVVSAVMFSVEKSATLEAPSATAPPAQFDETPQSPEFRKLQVPPPA